MRRTFIQLVLVCIIGYGLVSCTRRTVTLQEGRELEEQGNYTGALKHYQRMPDPEFRDVCEHNLYHLYGDILDAIDTQRETPNSAEAFYNLGKVYYEKALSIPDEHEVVPNLGFDTKTYFAKQQERFHSQAQTTVESATQLQPNYQEALLLKGNLYEETEQPEKAIPVYQQLVDLDPETPEAFSRLGMLLHEQGQTEEGLELAEQAVDMGPENPDAHFTLGILYAREEHDKQAIVEFQQALCYNPRHVEAYYKIAQLYLKHNNIIDAERVLLLGVMNNPESQKLALLYNTLKSVLDAKEQEEAQRVYQQLAAESGEVLATTDVSIPTSEEISPLLRLDQLRLSLNIVKRQRPYVLPCADMEEHPYFIRQIMLLQEKIEKLEPFIQSEEEEAAPTNE